MTECGSENLLSCLGKESEGRFQFCVGKLCIHVGIIIFLVLLIFGSIAAGIYYKTEFFYGLARKTTKKAAMGEGLDGEYKIINKDFKAKSPVQRFVFEQINNKGGLYDSEKYAENSPYPEVLLDSTVEKLIEDNVIKKIG